MGRPTAGSSAAAFVAASASGVIGGGWDSLGGALGAEAVSHWEALKKMGCRPIARRASDAGSSLSLSALLSWHMGQRY